MRRVLINYTQNSVMVCVLHGASGIDERININESFTDCSVGSSRSLLFMGYIPIHLSSNNYQESQ